MKLFTLSALLLFLTACGDARTSAPLRSPDDIKAKTDTFTVGTTKISDVLTTLGMWNSSSGRANPEFVNYWTNDGGETRITFGAACPNGDPTGCFSEAQHLN